MGENIDIDEFSKELAKEYDEAQKVGKKYISAQWKSLKAETKSYLVASGCYHSNGRQLEVETFSSEQAEEVQLLEHHVGYLQLCASYNLPSRSSKNAIIPRTAYSENVFIAIDELLYTVTWHDPVFLRLALRAYRNSQMVNLMEMLPPIKEESGLFIASKATIQIILGLIALSIILASPYFLGLSLTSAAKGHESDAIFSFYMVGLAIWSWLELKERANKNKKGDFKNIYDYEFEYNEWKKIDFYKTSWCSTGAGAKFYIEAMAKKGVHVEPIAIDICATLEKSLFKKMEK